MFINKNEQPIELFQSPLTMRLSLIICVIGIITVGFAGFIFEHFNLLSQ
jgi:hypothetical protein